MEVIDIAKRSIKVAKEIGANAIKLQTYRADPMPLNCKKDDFIVKGGPLWDGKTLYDLYQWAYTPWEWHKDYLNVQERLALIYSPLHLIRVQ